jgi:hypothetical protein
LKKQLLKRKRHVTMHLQIVTIKGDNLLVKSNLEIHRKKLKIIG